MSDDSSRADYITEKLTALLKLRQDKGATAGKENRDLFLFCLYNSAVRGVGHEEALQRVDEFNRLFFEPMTAAEIEEYLRPSVKNRYWLKNAKIIEKLKITPEEQDEIGFYEAGKSPGMTKRARERDERRAAKADRNSKILELYRQGHTATEAAAAVNCSVSTASRVISAAGLQSPADLLGSDICSLRQEGHTIKEIAETTGVTKRTVYYHLQRARAAGAIFPVSQIPEEARQEKALRDEIILEHYGKGETAAEIAAAVGCTPPTVKNVLQRAGKLLFDTKVVSVSHDVLKKTVKIKLKICVCSICVSFGAPAFSSS